MSDQISPQQFQEAEGVEDWRVVGDGACTVFSTRSFAESARLVQAIGELDGVQDHPPAVDVRSDGVTLLLVTVEDDHYGMTERDVRVARLISATARDFGLAADPSPVQSVLVIPGASDPGEVMPFWQAVLRPPPRLPRRRPRRSAGSRAGVLVRGDGRASSRRPRRDPRRRLAAGRTG